MGEPLISLPKYLNSMTGNIQYKYDSCSRNLLEYA